jgi:hypothetical protein
MDGRRPAMIHPGVTTGSIYRDTIALYPQAAMVDLAQSHTFYYQVSERPVTKTVDYRTHSAQVPQAFFTHIGDQPDIPREGRLIRLAAQSAQLPQEAKESRNPERVIANTGAFDYARAGAFDYAQATTGDGVHAMTGDVQVGGEGENSIQMGANY